MSFTRQTDRLVLREYIPSDWESVQAYAAIPEVTKYEAWGPNKPDETKKFVADCLFLAKQNPRYKFEIAVTLPDGKLIGGVGIRRESQESFVANMGWVMHPEFQNRGYITEAARSLIDFGFNDLNLKVIYATCDSRNAPSYRVMEKIGMKKVGILIGVREFKGEVSDMLRYEIISPGN